LLLEETPSTTLKKLAEHIMSKFDIQVTPAAIQKTLKKIEVT
jgi:transposase